MSVARKDAFIQWVLNERAEALIPSSKPTISDLRQNALKYGYEIRTVVLNGVEVAKIRWSSEAQFEFIDDFIANHQAKLRSSYLDLERRLSICGVSAETKHNSSVRQSDEYLALQRERDELQNRVLFLEAIIKEFGESLAMRSINWDALSKYDAELSERWRSESLRAKQHRT